MFLAFTSCEDDVNFSIGKSSNVVFSTDTLQFDTVFSNIGTSYQRIKVYNSSRKGIRVPQIRLASNGESGFQVNVDGMSGNAFSDVEIYDKDSIFLFVKLLPKVQGSDAPVEIKDSLIFSFANGIEQYVHLRAFVQDATVLNSFIVDDLLVLNNVKPYIIYDSLHLYFGYIIANIRFLSSSR